MRERDRGVVEMLLGGEEVIEWEGSVEVSACLLV